MNFNITPPFGKPCIYLVMSTAFTCALTDTAANLDLHMYIFAIDNVFYDGFTFTLLLLHSPTHT